ncbi:hypothetical protein C943_01636 [Mariniradius saccharolyticus AK6]|uniref:Uncharacterized protein n=1 Tax=Mariniradius saccharolyticus AK6 TaxID=1239962 RepID=M7Y486_9BACT|nr:hypothetical protein C943_01636 [Mariniradius saccharolyticus AK6]
MSNSGSFSEYLSQRFTNFTSSLLISIQKHNKFKSNFLFHYVFE